MKFYLLLFSLIGILSCSKNNIVLIGEETTFGIRHDKDLSEYEAIVSQDASENLPNFKPVVSFEYSLDGSDNRDFVATGTLIAKQWILTAGHNFFVAEEQDTVAPIRGIVVHIGNDPNKPEQSFLVEELVFHPTWIAHNDDFVNANDLCLVKLKNPVKEVKPAKIFSSDKEQLGNKVWFCGFGDYSNLRGQDSDLLSKKHALENILDRKTKDIVTSSNGKNYNGGLLAFDFDHPAGVINTLGDDTFNEEELLLGKGTSSETCLELEGTTIEGDSGGPLFIKDENTWKLVGVLSGGVSEPFVEHEDGSYGDISVFIRVSQQVEWINSVVK